MPAILFLKAALPAGARWITVRPNGPGTEGHPVLIQPSGDGAFRVIGGAGGKLNYLKLTGVKSVEEYRHEAAQKAAARRDADKRQKERDREAGLTESKAKAREVLKAQVGGARAKFIQTVADTMGWKPEELRFPEEEYQNKSPAAVKKAAEAHARALMQRAVEAVDFQRQRLVQDADARAEAGLGEVKLVDPNPETLSVQDLDPVEPEGKGLGYATEYGKRAAEAGLTDAELKQEAAAAKPPPKVPPKEGEPSPAERRKATAEAIGKELEGIRDPGPKVDPREVVDAKKAVELLKAAKQLKAVQAEATAKRKMIDAAQEKVEPNAFVIEVAGRAPDVEVTKDLENDLRTLRTRAFLEEVGRQPGGLPALGRHVGVGAYQSLNALALAAGGDSLVDRSVVDVLGVAGAAQVLARRLDKDLSPEEFSQVKEAIGTFHVDHYMKLSESTLREAREWQEMAHEIEVGEASTTADLAVAQEMNAKRRDFVAHAQRALGTALGEMEMNATLVSALEAPDRIAPISLGSVTPENAIRQARAIGLDRGDYQVEKIGASTFLTLTGEGMDKLAKPVARDDLERTRAALDIMAGREDEAGWLPGGVTTRADAVLNAPAGVAPRLAQSFKVGEGGIGHAIRDYIGGRAADGDPPADIVAGLLSEDTLRAAGDRDAFMQELDRIAPLYAPDGSMIRAEAHQGAFDKLADAFVDRLGGERAPLHRQKFEVDHDAVQALHVALSQHPDGVLAFKPVGDLSASEQGALRRTFLRQYGKSDPESDRMRSELDRMEAAEPAKETQGLFGSAQNPEWSDWKRDRDSLAEKLNASSMTWGKYLQVMGSPANAYAAMQDVVRSDVLRSFAEAHNRLKPGAALKIGRTPIAHDLNHLDALDPEARERRLVEHRGLVDRLRNRVAGRYAGGSVAEKVDQARAAEEAAQQAQISLFGASEEPPPAPGAAEAPKEAELGQRYTIGHAAERQIAGMMPIVGKNFRPGEKAELWRPTMDGKFIGRQRAVKLIAKNRRVILAAGVGSGKTSIMLSAFTHMKGEGKAKRGLFVVPSVVQGQFHGEALTLLQPGKFNWHCDPGASREERIAGYKDPKVDFSVVTHQAFRDDLLHLAAQREGSTPKAVAEKLDAMQPAERATFMRGVMEAEGIDHDYLATDEAHNLLNREGKQDSNLANVVDAVTAHPDMTYVSASADPAKNDASEVFDLLRKMDPGRYGDRDAFMRKYGVDTVASQEGLRRELAKYMFAGSIASGVTANKGEVAVKLSDAERGRIAEIDKAAAQARLARMKGGVDVAALRTLSPGSFEGVEEGRHGAVAAELNRSIGILRDMATHHVVNGSSKVDAVVAEAGKRKGVPGVIFARRLDRVKEIAAKLKAEGHEVLTLTGAHSSAEKDRIKREFKGSNKIMVASDAAAVGANLQTGKWLAQFDTPMTAMLHRQRQGRIDRVGQTSDVDLVDLVADHPAERRDRKRLAEKYDLRNIMTSPLEGLDDTGIGAYLNRARSGELEAAQPHFVPAAPDQVPEGLAPPDEQHSLF